MVLFLLYSPEVNVILVNEKVTDGVIDTYEQDGFRVAINIKHDSNIMLCNIS